MSQYRILRKLLVYILTNILVVKSQVTLKQLYTALSIHWYYGCMSVFVSVIFSVPRGRNPPHNPRAGRSWPGCETGCGYRLPRGKAETRISRNQLTFAECAFTLCDAQDHVTEEAKMKYEPSPTV